MERRNFLFTVLATTATAAVAGDKALVMPIGKGFKVSAGESRSGAHLRMMGVTANVLDVKISGSDTAGALAVLEQTGRTPQGGPPLHVHPEQDELFYVLEGDYHFQVGEDRHELHPGDTIFLPRGVPHAFVQRGAAGRMIVAYQPAGRMEAFFEATAAWTAPPSKEEIARVFAAHGMQVLGPPLKVE